MGPQWDRTDQVVQLAIDQAAKHSAYRINRVELTV